MDDKQKFILSKRMTIPFGTYKGCLVEDILADDPGWLLWAASKIEGWELDTALQEEAEDGKALEKDVKDRTVYLDIEYLDEIPF